MHFLLVQCHAGEYESFFSIIPFFPMLNSNYWEVGKLKLPFNIHESDFGKRLKFQEVNLVSL